MSKLGNKLCIQLSLIDCNVYSFVGGILISLATNVFTSLCFKLFETEDIPFYIATACFTIASACCIYISAKINGVQVYISKKNYTDSEKKQIVDDTFQGKKTLLRTYLLLFSTMLAGCYFLAYNTLTPYLITLKELAFNLLSNLHKGG